MSESLLTMIMYFWGRRNHAAMVIVFGLIIVRAPYVCFIQLFFTYYLESLIKHELIGIFLGHFFYYFSYIFPELPLSKGIKILETPKFFEKFCSFIGLDKEGGNDILLDDDELEEEDLNLGLGF